MSLSSGIDRIARETNKRFNHVVAALYETNILTGEQTEALTLRLTITPNHELKAWPLGFAAVLSNAKTHELRKDDRDYKVGDVICLSEWDPILGAYSGRTVFVRVTYITRGTPADWGLMDGYCILSIEKL